MALHELLVALERDARAEAERLLEAARAEAAAIAAAVEGEVNRRRALVLDARVAELRHDLERALSEARLAARRDILLARERLLGRVFTAARAVLPGALDDPRYRAALTQHVAEALAAFGPEEAVVATSAPALASAVKPLLAGRATLETDDAVLGVRFRSGDGAISVDATLDARLEARRRELARTALRELEFEP